MSGDDDGSPGRINASRPRAWVVLDANRYLLAALIAVLMYVALVVVATAWPTPLREIATEFNTIPTLFQALATAVVTVVTFVVTINQVVLSQELGAVGDQRERMQEAMDFRREVGDHLDDAVSPPTPSAFLEALVEASRQAAERLEELSDDESDDELRERLAGYADGIVDNAEEVIESLDDAQFGTFQVVSAALKYNYSYKIYEGRSLHAAAEDRVDEETLAELEELIEVLTLFGPAREHFKTLYFQWELTDLSRGMLFTGVPALVVAIAGLLLLGDPSQFPGSTLGVGNLTWVLVAAVVAALVPFFLLLSVILRIAVVAKRTLAMGPFVLREDERVGDEDE